MTFAVGQRSAFVAQRFQRSREDVYEWFQQPLRTNVRKATGFRITAVPGSGGFAMPRLFGTVNDLSLTNAFRVVMRYGQQQPTEYVANTVHMPNQPHPILRGVRMADYDGHIRIDLYADGTVEVGAGFDTVRGATGIFVGWIIAYLVNALQSVDYLRIKAGAPDTEYAVECEILSSDGPVAIFAFGAAHALSAMGSLTSLPLLLPKISFGPMSELNTVMTQVFWDLCDAMGGSYPELPRIEVAS
jgi:hypothetical protein